MSNKIFSTSVVNLEILQKIKFFIPTYQRPYVWGDEQIKKLLEDFYKSFQYNSDGDYYIGTILTKESIKDNQLVAELIDGQQRFTTLWLTAFVFSRRSKSSNLEKFLRNSDESLKIGFEIRTEIESYFKHLLEKDKSEVIKIIQSGEIEKHPYLKNISKAIVVINAIIDVVPDDELKSFGDYIYSKIRFIKNTTPEKTDLNKLFSTINSAGVQLEQTDIVKSNLLRRIDDKVLYGKIWELCENMNNFFERNVLHAFPKTKWFEIDLCKYNEFHKNVFCYEDGNIEAEVANESNNVFIIDDIASEIIEDYIESDDEKRESEEIYCRSIINFGQLLLHTYRLHLKNEGLPDFEGTFHIKRLIEIFKSLEARNSADEIKRFILLLWKVRYLFDKYVIKWISDVDTKIEQLELININKSSDKYTRTKYAKSSMLMLQSVLYFTGDYLRQFWLTTYLGYLLGNHNDFDATSDIHLSRLEKIDNDFSLCKTITAKSASLQLIDSVVDTNFNYDEYLRSEYGTKFQHYWFQKLEYILWKSWTFPKTNEFENYRIVSRNSIEHVYPQNPENIIKNPRIDDRFLHSFGNLVLLSVSQNSEYSNKSVDEKRSMFKNKNNSYDALKSYYILHENNNWTEIEIEQHQKNMVEKIKAHYCQA
ncbi:MAG: DUF262 domain-containing HNH endonuclease family protein [Candidatus Thiothrix sulfatifontis]|nr:MAG: DUF262 domain-containing HNH endonuclease family protein [Candidatus Thiothrix sulfatifontis]